jgi:hypothetical protein
MTIPTTTPAPGNFTRATIKVNWTYPDASTPYYIRSGQKIKLTATGNSYPGPHSYPKISSMATYFYEVTINPTNGSVITKDNFTLPSGSSWVNGVPGLVFRVSGVGQGAVGWPGPSIPGVPPNTNPASNPNMSIDSSVVFTCVGGNSDLTFTTSSRFVLPTWNNQTVNYYYTTAVTSPQYTLANKNTPLPCPGGPNVQFGWRIKYADKNRPYVIRRKNYGTVRPPGGGAAYNPTMNTNRLELTITNPVNIAVGSTFEFRIINVAGDITSADIGGVTFGTNKTWTSTTGSGNTPISLALIGRGTQGTEKFKIRITHRPPTRVVGGCTYTYNPVVSETPIISIVK